MAGSITITVREATAITQAIAQLPPLHDVKISYRLGYFANKCEQAAKKFERDRAQKAKEWSAPTEVTKPDGSKMTMQQLPQERHAEYSDYVEKLLDEELTIDRPAVKLEELMGPNNELAGKLSPGMLAKLQSVIVE